MQGVGLTLPPLSQPPNTDKLKKHISQVLDKMTKGGLEQAQRDNTAHGAIGASFLMYTCYFMLHS